MAGGAGVFNPVRVLGLIAGWLRQIIVNDAIPGLLIVQGGAGTGLSVEPTYLGGDLATSTVTGAYGTCHGVDCDVSGDWAGIGSGNENDVTGDYSFIGGGDDNVITAHRSFIGGGENNSITDAYGTIGGGYTNVVSGGFGIVGGGNSNTASGGYSAVVGGGSNLASSDYSFVGGGQNNEAKTSTHATVCGGSGNDATGQYSFVGGGLNNVSSDYYATVGGGAYNQATGYASVIPGGLQGYADKRGQHAHSAGAFAAIGDAQFSRLIARISATHDDDTWRALYLNGVDEYMTIPVDTIWGFHGIVMGLTQGAAKRWKYRIRGTIVNDGGTTTLLESTVDTDYESDADFDCQVTAWDAGDALLVQVRDATSGSDVVRWHVYIDFGQLSFPA